jgi:hypothetical protein
MRDFKTLEVWDKAHHLALAIYRATAIFPIEELYGLMMLLANPPIPQPLPPRKRREGDLVAMYET